MHSRDTGRGNSREGVGENELHVELGLERDTRDARRVVCARGGDRGELRERVRDRLARRTKPLEALAEVPNRRVVRLAEHHAREKPFRPARLVRGGGVALAHARARFLERALQRVF